MSKPTIPTRLLITYITIPRPTPIIQGLRPIASHRTTSFATTQSLPNAVNSPAKLSVRSLRPFSATSASHKAVLRAPTSHTSKRTIISSTTSVATMTNPSASQPASFPEIQALFKANKQWADDTCKSSPDFFPTMTKGQVSGVTAVRSS